jgi:hypothetical protein
VIRPACSLTFTCSSPYWKLTASPTADRVPELFEEVELVGLVVVVELLVVELVAALAAEARCEAPPDDDAVAVDGVLDAARLAPVEAVVAW